MVSGIQTPLYMKAGCGVTPLPTGIPATREGGLPVVSGVLGPRRNYQSGCATLTPLHSEWPKLHRVLAVLSAIGLSCNKGHVSHSRNIFQLR